MNFDELVLEVFSITNRPDLTTMTESAIRAATLKAHASDFFSKDIFESGIQFDTTGFIQSWDYVSTFSNFRAFKYFKRVEDENDQDGKLLTILTPDELLDAYGTLKTDIAYVAGRVLEIRASVEFQFSLVGVYVHPIVRVGAYNSWVAEQFPYAIIHEAARRVFKAIGQMEESNGQRELVSEEYAELKISAVTDVGS